MRSNFNSFSEFAQEIDRRESMKQDLIADTRQLIYKDNGGDFLAIEGQGEFQVNSYAQNQMSANLGIPAKYWERMKEVEGLRALNANAWFRKDPKKRMVRILDNNVRAIVSDQFKPYDNFVMLESLSPVLQNIAKQTDISVKAAILTDKRMYVQILFPKMQKEVAKVNDVITWGIHISNSEVGAGSVEIREFTEVLRCRNGMVGSSILRKRHAGRRLSEDDVNIYQSDTIQADIKAFELQLRDILKDALSMSAFENHIKRLEGAVDDQIEDVQKAVENVTKRYTELNLGDQKQLINNIIDTGHRNRYGLANSITWLAQETEDRDRSYDLERLGQKIITATDADWKDIAK